jgi:hypothetical protein
MCGHTRDMCTGSTCGRRETALVSGRTHQYAQSVPRYLQEPGRYFLSIGAPPPLVHLNVNT